MLIGQQPLQQSQQQQNFQLQNLISCSENIPKLELGECRRIMAQYTDYQLVTFYKDLLVVTLIATNQIEIGTLLTLEGEFQTICDAINPEIADLYRERA